jgi:hypothetical protein
MSDESTLGEASHESTAAIKVFNSAIEISNASGIPKKALRRAILLTFVGMVVEHFPEEKQDDAIMPVADEANALLQEMIRKYG